jgi:lycopene cyclase
MSAPADIACDIAIVGGGLAGGLAALALAKRRPDLDVRLVEGGAIGGNHVWSWFDSDIAPQHRSILEPLAAHHWDDYDIIFPAHRRTLTTGYNSTSGTALNVAVRTALAEACIVGAKAVVLEPDRLVLADQRSIAARHVLDARGSGDFSMLDCGWQKFLGQRLTVAGGHGLARPIVMDATVEQLDGYRFVYCLPFDAETVFVEDTYYADTRDLDPPLLRQRIADYAAAKGWQVTSIDGEEMGALPVVMGGDFEQLWPADDGIARIGVQICYEIIFSGQVVDRANRPQFIFNPSNDAWFGSWGPPQHLAQARLRAIEEGLPVIRATPTGISAVIDAQGRVRESLPMGVAGRIDTRLPPPHEPTLFARYGNILPLLFAGLLLAFAIASGRARR